MKNLTTTQKLAVSAVLLALCIASQFLKNTSVYITGSIINCILAVDVLMCGLSYAAIISVVTPITSFIITQSPIMKALPMVIPCVMIGNFLMVLFIWLLCHKKTNIQRTIIGMVLGIIAKAGYMSTVIALVIVGIYGEKQGLKPPAIAVAKVTFSLTQLITATIGCVLAFNVWLIIKKIRVNE